MSALKSLALAIEVATRARDQADQALMQARRAVQQAQGQLDQLESYAADTESRWATAAAVTISAELMHHHQHFLQRLHQATGMQGGVIVDLQLQAETARQRCVKEEVRLAALQQLVKKKLGARAQLEARREQKQMDELAILKYARGAGGAGGLLNGERS
ncbi:flagellar export protein FliJ [Curvibacter fontanus]